MGLVTLFDYLQAVKRLEVWNEGLFIGMEHGMKHTWFVNVFRYGSAARKIHMSRETEFVHSMIFIVKSDAWKKIFDFAQCN